MKSELTTAVAAVDSNYRYAYDFGDIGNRETSSERGTNFVYTANQLNQYTMGMKGQSLLIQVKLIQ